MQQIIKLSHCIELNENKMEWEKERNRKWQREREGERARISAQFSLNRQVFWPIESESDPKSRSANIIYLRAHTTWRGGRGQQRRG